jgi:hypothetical protein
VLACGESSSGPRSPTCEQGDTRPCLGPGRCDGAQYCGPSGWEVCECRGGENQGGSDGGGSSGSGGVGAMGPGPSGGSATLTGGSSNSSAGGVAGAPGGGDGGDGPDEHPCVDIYYDEWNCGACGHQCPSKLNGTCYLGSCQPGLIDCVDRRTLPEGTTCQDLCAAAGGVCTEQCNDSSGLSSYDVFLNEDNCESISFPSRGGRDCSTPIEWLGEGYYFIRCCCDDG